MIKADGTSNEDSSIYAWRNDHQLVAFFATSRILETPIDLNCGVNLNAIALPESIPGAEKMTLRYFYGRVWPSDRFFVVLNAHVGDQLYPELQSFTSDGRPVDHFETMPLCDSWGPSKESLNHGQNDNHLILFPDRSITEIDTTVFHMVTPSGKEIPWADSMQVTISHHRVDQNGYFIHLDTVSVTRPLRKGNFRR